MRVILSKMCREVVLVFLVYVPILSVMSLNVNGIFNIPNLAQDNSCPPTVNDSQRFFLKRKSQVYKLADVCDGIALTNLNYFPKCCPPGYSYKSERHSCVVNELNSSNVYEAIQMQLLVRSHLDCPVIIDQTLEGQSLVFGKSRAITYNNKSYNVEHYCVDWDISQNSTILRICETIEACKIHNCVIKCCKDGSSYLGGKCIWNYKYGITIENNTRFEHSTGSLTGVVQAKKCKRFRDKPKYNFTIKSDGKLVIKQVNKWVEYMFDEKMYCVEYLTAEDKYTVFLCALEGRDIARYKIYLMKTLNIISCVFLALTVLGYILLKELKNLMGKIIICYCICLLFATVLLTYSQFNPTQQSTCVPLGFLVIFFFLAAFAWMNVLSFEIWQALGSMSAQYGTLLYNERRKFFYYHIYAWSVPVLLLILGVISYYTETVPDNFRPIIGLRYCFIETNTDGRNYGYYIFLAIPSLLYIVMNLIFFIQTVRYIFKVKKDLRSVIKDDLRKRRPSFYVDKDRVIIVIRIFLIMGITWLFEFISTFQFDFSQQVVLQVIELLFDIINSLQGFFIFCVFMAKRTIWTAIKQKVQGHRRTRTNSSTVVGSV